MDPQMFQQPTSTPKRKSHLHLYIIVGILVVIAGLFFLFKMPDEPATIQTITPKPVPLGLKSIAITAEQLAGKNTSLTDPKLTQTASTTKKQAAVKQDTLTKTSNTTATALTDEQIKAKQASFNQ